MRDFTELLTRRESCRSYSDRPIEMEKLHVCLEAARLAPSACNSQPYAFTIVQSPDKVAAVAKCAQGGGMNKFAASCPCFAVINEEVPGLTARFGARMKKQDYTSIDIGIAAIQFCLAATEQGLSTCILGWFDEEPLKEILGIAKEKRVRLILCIGYAGTDAIRAKSRKTIEEIARFV